MYVKDLAYYERKKMYHNNCYYYYHNVIGMIWMNHFNINDLFATHLLQ